MSKEVTRTGGDGWSIEQTIENMTPRHDVQPKVEYGKEPAILETTTLNEPKLSYTPPEHICIFTGEVGNRQRFLNGKTIWLSDEAYEGHTTGEIVQQLNLKEQEWLKSLKSSSSVKSPSEPRKQSKKQSKK